MSKQGNTITSEINSFEDEKTGFRFYPAGDTFYPSVTTILDKAVPTDEFMKSWIREMGIVGHWLFRKAGDEGGKVHNATEFLEAGQELVSEAYSRKEKKCIQSFINWHQEINPNMIASEGCVINNEYKFAGRYDRIYEIEGLRVLVDFKTGSQNEKHKLQQAAYWKTLDDPELKTAILYLGTTSKKMWRYSVFDPNPYWEQFVHHRKTFDILYPDVQPSDPYPEMFKL